MIQSLSMQYYNNVSVKCSKRGVHFFRVNDVQKFRFSRPFFRAEEGEEENEFASLWIERTVMVTSYPLPGILRWFPVTSSDTFLISPLRNAIETMETTNKSVLNVARTIPLTPCQTFNISSKECCYIYVSTELVFLEISLSAAGPMTTVLLLLLCFV